MGTTIDDIYYDEYLAKQALNEEIDANFDEIVSSRLVDVDAIKIFDYLPVDKTDLLESEYINHLWKSFIHLDSGSEESRCFAILPIHLLFMLSLQYKVLRIYRLMKEKYDYAFTLEHPRDEEKDVLNPTSVFTLGYLNESKLIDIFKLVDVDSELIKRIKNLIKYRNDYLAHAKGGITKDIEVRLEEYFDCLSRLQNNFCDLNDIVAKDWLSKMGTGQEGVDFINTHMAEEYLCPADMQEGELSKLDKKD